MELLHKGFDALDLAYPVHFPAKHIPKLEQAKVSAGQVNTPIAISLNGVKFSVASTGARGGYAFRLTTGKLGEIWFVKKPNARDPWGIRISVSAVQLAVCGLSGVRERLEQKFEALGLAVRAASESIARVDFAIDLLMSGFVLQADNFVMQQQFTRMKHADLVEYKEGGKSGRTTSVTVGKNPNRQLIVYNKRAEVLAKGNSHWPVVWNKNREEKGLPPLDLSDPETSQVWRVELRLYKKHLKEDWRVATWYQLQQKLPLMFNKLLDDVRYTRPTLDQNRSRWPEHELWQRVRDELNGNLAEMRSFASEHNISEMQKLEREQMLLTQIAGCIIAYASSRNIEFPKLSEFVAQVEREVIELFRSNPAKTERKLNISKGNAS